MQRHTNPTSGRPTYVRITVLRKYPPRFVATTTTNNTNNLDRTQLNQRLQRNNTKSTSKPPTTRTPPGALELGLQSTAARCRQSRVSGGNCATQTCKQAAGLHAECVHDWSSGVAATTTIGMQRHTNPASRRPTCAPMGGLAWKAGRNNREQHNKPTTRNQQPSPRQRAHHLGRLRLACEAPLPVAGNSRIALDMIARGWAVRLRESHGGMQRRTNPASGRPAYAPMDDLAWEAGRGTWEQRQQNNNTKSRAKWCQKSQA